MGTIGKRLKWLRQQKGATQEQIAEILNIGQSTYANYEIDRRIPNPEMLVFLADYYGVPIDFIMGAGLFKDSENLVSKREELARNISSVSKQITIDALLEMDSISFIRVAYAYNDMLSISNQSDYDSSALTESASNALPQNDISQLSTDEINIISIYRNLDWDNKVLLCAKAVELKQGVSPPPGESDAIAENALPSNGTEGVA